ncbi:glycoside hydrolase family protein [Mangrovibacter sp. SLW1]
MSQIIPLLNFEEGFRSSPYIDTEGYPTFGTGFKIGPKGASLSNYTLTIPKEVNDVWLQSLVDSTIAKMNTFPTIVSALAKCNGPRTDVLISMAYQMGPSGLSAFKNTLAMVAQGNFSGAAAGMLDSLWARQTPHRAKRHSDVMSSGTMDAYVGKL